MLKLGIVPSYWTSTQDELPQINQEHIFSFGQVNSDFGWRSGGTRCTVVSRFGVAFCCCSFFNMFQGLNMFQGPHSQVCLLVKRSLPCKCLVKDREAWHAAVHGAAKVRTRLGNSTTNGHCRSYCENVCVCQVTSVMSDAVKTYGLQPARLRS